MITGEKLSSFFKMLADAFDSVVGLNESDENGLIGALNTLEKKDVVNQALSRDNGHDVPPSPL